MMTIKSVLSNFIQKMVGNIFWSVDQCSQNEVFLTFDDGPHPEYTGQILDILEHYSVKATFFLVGQQVTELDDLVLKMHEHGHSIGIHGFTHMNPKHLTLQSYLQEIKLTKRAIEDVIGVTSNYSIVRPPYGTLMILPTVLLLLSKYRIIMWNKDSMDWFTDSPEKIVENVVFSGLSGGDIILFHDDCLTTVKTLPKLIETMLSKGYIFGRIS